MLVFLCLETREAIVTEATEHPNSAWVCEQADWLVEQTADREKKPDIILHDRDTKFTRVFAERLKSRGLRTNALPKASPNLNGRVERYVGTLRWECLDKFIIFGKRHLDYLVAEFTSYYNTKRAHMQRDHLPPVRQGPEEVDTIKLDEVEVKPYVGGLVKSFERKAA